MTHHHHGQDSENWRNVPEDFIEHLGLEARLNAPIREAGLNLADDALVGSVSNIVDLGSGTGADAIALAQHFPDSRVHALDVSAELLDRVGASAHEAGVSTRIKTHQVDLNTDWSDQLPSQVDLVWSALSMHHVDDPALGLRRVLSTLRPGGVFVLIELTGESWLAPDDLGTGRAGLQDRLSVAAAQNAHARSDWPALLEQAGFTDVKHRDLEFAAHAQTSDGAQYLSRQLLGQRDQLEADGASEDLAALNSVTEALEAGTSGVSYHSGRVIWVASRPVNH